MLVFFYCLAGNGNLVQHPCVAPFSGSAYGRTVFNDNLSTSIMEKRFKQNLITTRKVQRITVASHKFCRNEQSNFSILPNAKQP